MQKLLARCCLVIVLVGATVSGVGARAADGTEAAVSAAEAWLAHMDGADYAAGWRDGAAILKAAVTVKEFARALASARTPLGQLISRKLISKQRTRSLPGAPDGDYVVIQYETRFVNKAQAVETITPMRQADGSWKVAGYYIR